MGPRLKIPSSSSSRKNAFFLIFLMTEKAIWGPHTCTELPQRALTPCSPFPSQPRLPLAPLGAPQLHGATPEPQKEPKSHLHASPSPLLTASRGEKQRGTRLLLQFCLSTGWETRSERAGLLQEAGRGKQAGQRGFVRRDRGELGLHGN